MSQHTMTDAELVAAHLAGDRDALAAIYDRHGASLYDTAAAMLSDRHEAADVVQDVVVVAAERMTQLRDPSRLRAWLFAILRNEVYRRTRRRKRTVPTDFTAPGAEMAAPIDPDIADTAVDEIDHGDLSELVRAAAAGLDARDQLVLELSVRQDLQGAELAAALGVSAQQCYGLVHRMRERTERSLAAYCVARAGRRDCDELAAMLAGWDGEFTVLIRKRVARHIDRCESCARSRRKVAPLALLRSAPAMAAPPDLRDRILAAASAGGASATSIGSSLRFDGPDGFPSGPAGRGWVRRGSVIAAAAVFITGAMLLTTVRPAEAPEVVLPPAPADSTVIGGADEGDGVSLVDAEADVDGVDDAEELRDLDQVDAVDAVDETIDPPDVAAPDTSEAPGRPTTTTAPAAPGLLVTSASSLDFGPAATTRTVTLSNPGGQPVTWSSGGAAPFTQQPSNGTLAPGASTVVTFSLDRGAVPEGPAAATATFNAPGVAPRAVSLTADIRRPPVITLVAAPSSPLCLESSITFATVSATITDEQAVTAVLQWSGPAGQVGSAPMTGTPLSSTFALTGAFPELTGAWAWTIVATDALGNVAQRSGSFTAQNC